MATYRPFRKRSKKDKPKMQYNLSIFGIRGTVSKGLENWGNWKSVEESKPSLPQEYSYLLEYSKVSLTVEYIDCFSAEGYDSPNECPGYIP